MDMKMKSMMMAGMATLCLVFGMMAIFSNSWLSETDEETGETTSNGLENSMIVNTYKTSTECEGIKDVIGLGAPGEISCDGKELTIIFETATFCEPAEGQEMTEECVDLLSANTKGSMGMWAGASCALIAMLMLVLPMVGIGALDHLPNVAKTVLSWGAGGLMLLGVLMWFMMLPDGDMSASTGVYMAVFASLLGLGSAFMDTFVPAQNITPSE
jgi:hypothetical protein